ncbi:MAG TPA: class I SAM-dependent methyltransferase [Steroidobacteraceae bacterium]|jgi:SAM-dependent methyltransferase|nr:class I SAM-dependent methyltransferase [Steroidobacteraceae bacterium]
MERQSTSAGLLGDTTARDYSRKLRLFNVCAEPELRQAVASLKLAPGMRVLDAGCGTGEALAWLRDAVGEDGIVIGLELAAAHVIAARTSAAAQTLIVQADVLKPPLADASLDLIWCVNTINHLRDPVIGVERLAALLRRGGRLALGQSSLLPDMYFAWDSRLERVINEAVRQYYRERYRLEESELTAIRSIVGVLRKANMSNVRARSFMIERVAPLSASDRAYLLEAIFQDTWNERLRPYLSGDDYQELSRLCDPHSAAFALHRPDFHFLQSFTVVVGEA